MNNIELPAKLADYFVNDLNVAYTFKPKSIFKEIIVMGLVNNFLDKKMFQMATCMISIRTITQAGN
jgi:iron complex outermembrane receptor protein